MGIIRRNETRRKESKTTTSLLFSSILALSVSGSPSYSEDDCWNVPLYLWGRDHTVSRDTVLLPNAPSAYLPSASNYSLVYPDPLALGCDLQGKPASHPLASLRLFQSSERGDLLTTTTSLPHLNSLNGGESCECACEAVPICRGTYLLAPLN